MKPAVSILVPVYNVSLFIERCAHSLFRQTFEDIEYVFVNDGCTDDSIEILQKTMNQYPEKRQNIKLIHHSENKGIGAARKTALANSTGKFILWTDSDDYIEKNMVELLYSKIVEENSDIAVCDYYIERHQENNWVFNETISENNEENIANIILQKVLSPCLWNKMIKRDLYKKEGCQFIDGLNYSEDKYLMIVFFYYAQKVAKVDIPLYHYTLYNSEAITRKREKIHFENVVLFWSLADEFLKDKGLYDKLRQKIELAKVRNKASLFTGTNSNKLRRKYIYLFREIEMKYLKHLRFGEKLVLLFSHYRMTFLADIVQKLIWRKNK